MANIVNTPITMYVKEHNLELYGDSITELMEYNSYPIEVYSDEELDGCHLVKRHQNSQQLVSVGQLKKDVRRLLRSPGNDGDEKIIRESKLNLVIYKEETQGSTVVKKFYNISDESQEIKPEEGKLYYDKTINKIFDYQYSIFELNEFNRLEKKEDEYYLVVFSKKAWWIFLENLNETATIGTTTKTLYGGILKSYNYEKVPTVVSNIDRIFDYEVIELGEVQIYFTNNDFSDFEIHFNPNNSTWEYSDEVLKKGDLSTDFLNIPLPQREQVSLEIPETVKIEQLELDISSLGLQSNTTIFENLVLNKTSYDEENGYYYYQKTLDNYVIQYLEDTETVTETRTDGVFSIVCKFFEDNFNIYSITINASFFYDSGEEKANLSFSYDEKNDIKFKWENISFEEREFDVAEVLLNETFDDYANIYTLYTIPSGEDETPIQTEFYSDKYNGAGLNELLLGLRKQNAQGITEYVTNSISLTVLPSIESDAWFVPPYDIKKAYLGILETEEGSENIKNFKNQYNVYYPQEVDSLYIDMENYTLENNKIVELKAYIWNPNTENFELTLGFITLSEQGKPTSGTEEGTGGSGDETPVELETT